MSRRRLGKAKSKTRLRPPPQKPKPPESAPADLSPPPPYTEPELEGRRDLYRFNEACIDRRLREAIAFPQEVAKLIRCPAFGVRIFPLFDPAFCRELISLADEIDIYEPDPQDPYPGREFDIDLVKPLGEVMERVFHAYVRQVVEVAFDGFKVERLSNVFVLRYSPDTQASMGAHFDEQSDVSMCVALNTDYEGMGLGFPRFGYTTHSVPGEPERSADQAPLEVGEAVLFPGRVTHLHEAPPVTKGRRYSQTWWMLGGI